ncbi:MAG: hypothetical protein FWH29_02505 [Methanobrevibacter sp.]|nr:hypothetical protein [Methanobrevibacter sp.]
MVNKKGLIASGSIGFIIFLLSTGIYGSIATKLRNVAHYPDAGSWYFNIFMTDILPYIFKGS